MPNLIFFWSPYLLIKTERTAIHHESLIYSFDWWQALAWPYQTRIMALWLTCLTACVMHSIMFLMRSSSCHKIQYLGCLFGCLQRMLLLRWILWGLQNISSLLYLSVIVIGMPHSNFIYVRVINDDKSLLMQSSSISKTRTHHSVE